MPYVGIMYSTTSLHPLFATNLGRKWSLERYGIVHGARSIGGRSQYSALDVSDDLVTLSEVVGELTSCLCQSRSIRRRSLLASRPPMPYELVFPSSKTFDRSYRHTHSHDKAKRWSDNLHMTRILVWKWRSERPCSAMRSTRRTGAALNAYWEETQTAIRHCYCSRCWCRASDGAPDSSLLIPKLACCTYWPRRSLFHRKNRTEVAAKLRDLNNGARWPGRPRWRKCSRFASLHPLVASSGAISGSRK